MRENLRSYRREAAAALRAIRRHVRWKQGKAAAHLEKRKDLGHLPAEYSVEKYNELIQALVQGVEHRVYFYRFGSKRYYAVRGTVRDTEWLVIATKEGVIETAFPPDAIDDYLSRRGFILIGTIQEVFA